jgi:hypothetical protein
MSWLRLMEESIKSGIPAGGNAGGSPAGGSAEGNDGCPPAAGSRKKHKVRHLIKEMWPAYLIEIFVIILGISITLALEEWRDNSKELQLEKVYQKNLLADIESDLQSLQYARDKTQKFLTQGNDLLDYIKNGPGSVIPAKQAYADLQGILERPNFIASDATFSDLKNSGNMHLLKDIPLKNLLFAYYSQAQGIIKIQDAEQQATITISGPYFLKNFPMGGGDSQQSMTDPGKWQDLSKNIELGNNVLLRVANRRELLENYQKASLMAIQLKSTLTSKVNE